MLLNDVAQHVLAVAAGDLGQPRLHSQRRLRRIQRDFVDDSLEIGSEKLVGILNLWIRNRRQKKPLLPRQGPRPVDVLQIHLFHGTGISDGILTPNSHRARCFQTLDDRSLS